MSSFISKTECIHFYLNNHLQNKFSQTKGLPFALWWGKFLATNPLCCNLNSILIDPLKNPS